MYYFSNHVFLYLFYLNTHKSRTNSYCVTLSLIELLSIPLKSGAKHVNVTNRPRRSKFFRHHQTHTHTYILLPVSAYNLEPKAAVHSIPFPSTKSYLYNLSANTVARRACIHGRIHTSANTHRVVGLDVLLCPGVR